MNFVMLQISSVFPGPHPHLLKTLLAKSYCTGLGSLIGWVTAHCHLTSSVTMVGVSG